MPLTPWREIVTPHPDIARGRYHQAEFAAHLGEVIAGNADAEYQDPIEFFARTYLTAGMRRLLATAVKQITGKDGEPIVQLKTAFGGGKTHSMLALYHLLGGTVSVDQMEGARHILNEAEVSELPKARFAVIVGTALNPSRTQKVNGITTRTLWGNIAAQLGGQEGYTIVKAADKKSVAPGANDLTTLLNEFGPAIILIDELVAYTRNIYGVNGLPAGSFDANLTFVQSLTEAVKNAERSQLVASIPESDIEIGGEAGKAALERIQHTIGRLEGIWRPVDADEGFEIVRRRLFSPVRDKTAHDAVCRAFTQLYDENPSDFPVECRDALYLDRLRRAYPIHPELFDRLYEDWSPLDNFQKTRGVLRFMAAVIHHLWINEDRSPLILPGSIPLDSPRVREELLRYLPENWNAVVDKDVDGDRSEPRAIDEGNTRFGEISAARRVARTIFMGSAPHGSGQTVRGLEEMRIRLGVAQPDEHVSVFNDATKRLTDRLTHLYTRAQRYWYDTHPNLRRTMEDRAAKQEPEVVESEIVRRLRQQTQRRGDFKAVHPCPVSADVPDESTARLVILSPTTGHQTRAKNSAALTTASEILEKRGDIPRKYSNMLIFVAPDTGEWDSLERETRCYLAWDSIVQEAEGLNLDANQRREARRGKEQSNDTVGIRLNEAYSWLLVPTQEGTEPIVWEETRIPGSQETAVAKAVAKVRDDAQLITQWSPVLLKMELDNWLWKEEPHISLKRVWECLATYLYLSRLRDSDVLLDTVREGIKTQTFGYANSVDDTGQYNGLQFGSAGGSLYLDDESVLVKPDVAVAQLEANAAAKPDSGHPQPPESPSIGQGGRAPYIAPGGQTTAPGTGTTPPQTAKPKRFYGTVNLDPIRTGPAAQRIVEEVVQHLAGLPGADVEVTMEIQAKVSDGVPDDIVRTVTENCRTLRFTTQEFEEE
ncbi:ATP-binding protein [Candidatus Poribacteria bacterium]|nr:ATP-binding protein [Candidatus Poribacteria bacterium]MYA57890.1 ATP-binding protein [Candidatus Poribacteria bacterium]